MPVAARLREALEHEQAHALRETRTVGLPAEGAAAPVARQPTLAREDDKDSRCSYHRHPARECQLTLAPAQRLTGEVDRHQRGGARRVDRHRGALEAEGIGDAPGGDAARDRRAEKALEL